MAHLTYQAAIVAENEIRLTARIIYKKNTENFLHDASMPMMEILTIIKDECRSLMQQELTGFPCDIVSRIDDWWVERNHLMHEPDYIYRINHQQFQEDTFWMIYQFRQIQRFLLD